MNAKTAMPDGLPMVTFGPEVAIGILRSLSNKQAAIAKEMVGVIQLNIESVPAHIRRLAVLVDSKDAATSAIAETLLILRLLNKIDWVPPSIAIGGEEKPGLWMLLEELPDKGRYVLN